MFKNGLIIAGGFGSRMMPLTEYLPKPLVKFNGKELIDYGLELFKKNNITNIVCTYGHKSDQLVSYLNGKVNVLLNTINQDNSYFIYNTILKNIDEPFVLIPCDIITDIDFKLIHDEYLNFNSPPCLIIPNKVSNVDADFIESDSKNRITSINRVNKSNLIASGIQIINPYKINNVSNKHNNFYNVWSDLISSNNLYVSNIYPNKWYCVDNLNQII